MCNLFVPFQNKRASFEEIKLLFVLSSGMEDFGESVGTVNQQISLDNSMEQSQDTSYVSYPKPKDERFYVYDNPFYFDEFLDGIYLQSGYDGPLDTGEYDQLYDMEGHGEGAMSPVNAWLWPESYSLVSPHYKSWQSRHDAQYRRWYQ